MEEYLKSIIKRYLNSGEMIAYALLINGEWGSGKTWFIKNDFESEYKKEIIYTSANGITSVDEISEQILFKNIINNKRLKDNPKLKLGVGIAKQVGGALLEKYTGYSIFKAKKHYQDLVDLASVSTDKVIIIDDLERIKKPLTIKELLGYVSRNFTEQHSVKVILLLNENELVESLEDSDSDYFSIKEKTIWQTIKFRVNHDSIYEKLAEKYNDDDCEFLLEHKELIVDMLKEYNVHNLRWVIYYFSNVLEVKNKYGDDLFIDKYKEVILNTVLIICIEYKSGKIIQEIDDDPPYYMERSAETKIAFRPLMADEPTDKQTEFQKKAIYFVKTYLGVFKYHFFKSLYDLVCFGYLNLELFIKELKEYESLVEGQEDWHIKIDLLLNALTLEEEEFDEIWSNVMDYLDKGRYGINDLKNIAGIYETFTTYDLTFNITKDELYAKLHDQLTRINDFDSSREDNYRYMRDEYIENSPTYKNFIQHSDEKEYELLQQQNVGNIKETLNNLRNHHAVSASGLTNIIVLGSDDNIDELANIITASSKTYVFFMKYFERSLKEIRSQTSDKDKMIKTMKGFINICKEKTNTKNVMKANVHLLENKIEDYVLKYWS